MGMLNLTSGYAKTMKIVTAADKAMVKKMGENYNPHFVDCYHLLVVLPECMRDADDAFVRNEVAKKFDQRLRCWHDYDCCGCQWTTAYQHQMQRINRKLLLVAVTVNANY